MRYRGEVVRRRVARGSKSERVAVLLRTRGREYVLRREGGHPLRDPTLEELIGKTIECEGSIHEYVLIMSRWHVVG